MTYQEHENTVRSYEKSILPIKRTINDTSRQTVALRFRLCEPVNLRDGVLAQ